MAGVDCLDCAFDGCLICRDNQEYPEDGCCCGRIPPEDYDDEEIE